MLLFGLSIFFVLPFCVLSVYRNEVDKFVNEKDCPPGWVEWKQGFTCYRFSQAPPLDFTQAQDTCISYGGYLLAVETKLEHEFIVNWLLNHDPQNKQWYTGGKSLGLDLEWRWGVNIIGKGLGTGEQVGLQQVPFSFKDGWLRYEEHEIQYRPIGENLIYKLRNGEWGWDPSDGAYVRPYICEISKNDLDEADFIIRSWDYGSPEKDPEKIPRGPYFIEQPKETTYDLESVEKFVTLTCIAGGFPYPEYRWFKDNIEIKILQDTRFTLTNGKLTIHHPDRDTDRGRYYCIATNLYGSIISATVELNFGFLNDFTADERQPVLGYLHMGAVIECRAPDYFPAVNYYWFKNALPEYVPPTPRIFASRKGNLYFSKVVEADEANYICLVQSTVAASGVNSVGKTSREIKLEVRTNNAATERVPQIEVGFPTIFPAAPLAGEDVYIECVAQADPYPRYNWTRLGGPLPKKHFKENYERVLVIPNVQPNDEGVYICEAANSIGKKEERVYLAISSAPVFTAPLEDLHVDVGETVVLTCEAYGKPDVLYNWFRDGVLLSPTSLPAEDVARFIFEQPTQSLRTLTINQAQPGDSGMYQCQATNIHHTVYSTAQLRVLAFPPTFDKKPLPESMFAAVKGNFTIKCNPEAAPNPEYQWKLNGRNIGTDGRRRILADGTMITNDVRLGDAGTYECIATNSLGSASSMTNVNVLPSATISRAPDHARVRVGTNHVFECEASVDRLLDLAYVWLHNGANLDLEHSLHYETRIYNRPGYLLIRNTTFSQAGEYTCLVKTTVDEISESARLVVEGPPAAPSGVIARSVEQRTCTIQWSIGGNHGHKILSYIIEAHDNYTRDWYPVKIMSVRDEARRTDTDIVTTTIENLSPWNTYQVRVKATNLLGESPPSVPSASFFTKKAKPDVAPFNVSGGGGKIGDLHITWQPLTKDLWNAPGVGYRIFWRKLGSQSDFEKREFKEQRGQYTHRVGEENFYLPYEVKVQAFNDEGDGPESNVSVILSAENTPVVTPIDVQGIPYNSTAVQVYWTPLSDTRETMRGRLHGVRVEYWKKGVDERDAIIAIRPGANSEAIVIGLEPDTWYNVRVMAYNSAGNGEKSRAVETYTFKKAPQQAPTDVHVAPLKYGRSIRITWNGITTASDEEALIGYKIRILKAHEVDPTKYLDYFVGPANSYIIHDLEGGVGYRLRVLGFSNGGDGRQSAAELFQLGNLNYYLAAGNHCTCSISLIVIAILFAFLRWNQL